MSAASKPYGSAPPDTKPGTDPYFDWARATNFRYIGGRPDRVALLVELAPGRTYAEFVSLKWTTQPEIRDAVQFAPLFKTAPRGLKDARFCTVLIGASRTDIETFNRVILDPGWLGIVARYGFGFPPSDGGKATPPTTNVPPIIDYPPPPAVQGRPPAPVRPGHPVVMGVIDDSLAFANTCFRAAPAATRVEHIWNQENVLRPRSGAPSGNVSYGGELNRNQIDAWLAACTHAGQVDEDELYRRTGHESYDNGTHKAIGRRLGHGTHVLDLAAGYDLDEARPDRPIIAVQLPSEVTGDTSGAHLVTHVLDGIWYILKRADELARDLGLDALPVVVNLSYGFAAGPHDGSNALEAAIDEIIELRAQVGAPVWVVLPSGNSRLARGHGRIKIEPGAEVVLDWRVLPDDRTPSSMEVWLPLKASSGPGITVTVVDPAGVGTPAVGRGQLYPPTQQPPASCTIDYRGTDIAGGRERVVLLLLPTAPFEALAPEEVVARSGTWKVRLRNPGSQSLFVHAWIQRDDSPYGYPIVGRQSRFDDPDYVRFDRQGRLLVYDPPHPSVDPPPRLGYVTRKATLSALATGRHSVVVGGMTRSDLQGVGFSSMGPIIKGPAPQRIGPAPDVAAVCDDSRVLIGQLAAGTHSGSVVAMTGTSVAAPQITRMLADRMSSGLTNGRSVAQYEALRQEAQRPPRSALRAEEAGAGRIVLRPRRAGRRQQA